MANYMYYPGSGSGADEIQDAPKQSRGLVKEPMKAPTRRPAVSFLENGVKILGERAKLRDQPSGERSMERTVAIFNAWTGNEISVDDGWRFMCSLKMAREIQGFFHADDYEDLANYAALLGEEESANSNRQKP